MTSNFEGSTAIIIEWYSGKSFKNIMTVDEYSLSDI